MTEGLARFARAFVRAPAYPAADADRAMFRLVGLDLPVRATIAILVMTFSLLIDFHRDFLPGDLILGRTPGIERVGAIERLIMFAAVPLATVVFVFRDRPSGYGLRLGDWRAGIPLALVGCVLMTPVVLALGHSSSFGIYYAPSATDLPNLVATNVMDLSATEFIFRGFLMFALIRAIGPIGVVIAALPFVFSHFGKPELETLSTLFGGTVFGWLNWRTGSIWYSAVAHVYILTLITVAAVGWV